MAVRVVAKLRTVNPGGEMADTHGWRHHAKTGGLIYLGNIHTKIRPENGHDPLAGLLHELPLSCKQKTWLRRGHRGRRHALLKDSYIYRQNGYARCHFGSSLCYTSCTVGGVTSRVTSHS